MYTQRTARSSEGLRAGAGERGKDEYMMKGGMEADPHIIHS